MTAFFALLSHKITSPALSNLFRNNAKDKSETKYESHKKYIDVQYVIEGEELMGLTTLNKVKVTETYNEDNDIAFYEFEEGKYLQATPENFVVFFPEDVHRPGMKANEN